MQVILINNKIISNFINMTIKIFDLCYSYFEIFSPMSRNIFLVTQEQSLTTNIRKKITRIQKRVLLINLPF